MAGLDGIYGMVIDLRDMTETLAAVKGKEYANLVVGFFGMTNIGECLVDELGCSEFRKTQVGDFYANALLVVLQAALVPLFLQKNPGIDIEIAKDKFLEFMQEFGQDIDVLLKKQKECNL